MGGPAPSETDDRPRGASSRRSLVVSSASASAPWVSGKAVAAWRIGTAIEVQTETTPARFRGRERGASDGIDLLVDERLVVEVEAPRTVIRFPRARF
jgi:hypothetical protein